MNEEIKFSNFIDSVGEGAARSRSIISYIMIATSITALALFNSLKPDKNWLASRITSLHSAKAWAYFPDETKRICKDCRVDSIKIDTQVISNHFTFSDFKDKFSPLLGERFKFIDSVATFPNNVELSFPEYCLDRDRKILVGKVDSGELRKAIKYFSEYKDRNIAVSELELNWQITNFNRAFIDNSLLINIPILGISFDVNGLAIISAVTFCFLFFLLLYNLARERKNLTLVFKRAEKSNIDKVALYQLLSMRQVLTIPGSIDEYIELKEQREAANNPSLQRQENPLDKAKFYFLNVLTFLPVLIPVLTWYQVYLYDTGGSENVGYSTNEELTKWTFEKSKWCGRVMFGLWLICVYEWVSIVIIWNQQQNAIKQILLGNPAQKNEESTESESQ